MLPTILTAARIAAVPLLVVVFYLPFAQTPVWCAGIFAAAMLTDLLDGYLARKLKQESHFGSFLDPVADKLIVSVAIILLVSTNPSVFVVLPSLVIISREIIVLALREWMASLGKRELVAVSVMAKIKTVSQSIAITLMFYQNPVAEWNVYQTGLVLLYLAAILTLVSMGAYLRTVFRNVDGIGGIK